MTGDRGGHIEDRGQETEDQGQGGGRATFKFEKLEVYQRALTYVDMIYGIAGTLPKNEEHNLKSQITRAATSVVLNIAEGSTSQSDVEQRRFLGMAVRSLLETVACEHLIERRKYVNEEELSKTYEFGHTLFVKLQAMRRALKSEGKGL